MKYRLLTAAELEELRPEFIQFLASNTITAEDWKNYQHNDPEKTAEVIELFSDIVLEKVLSKITFIEYREQKSLMVFECLEKKMVLMGINIKGDADLTDDKFIQAVNKNPDLLNTLKLEIFRSEKTYIKQRETELFQLLQTGGLISDGKLFRILQNLKLSQN